MMHCMEAEIEIKFYLDLFHIDPKVDTNDEEAGFIAVSCIDN